MTNASRMVRLLAALVWIGLLVSPIVEGQEALQSLRVRTGSVLEIVTETTTRDAIVGWAFTKDREFLQARRGPAFSVRPTEPGRYQVNIELQEESVQHFTLNIDVGEQGPAPALNTDNDAPLLTTWPVATDDGVIPVQSGSPIIRFDTNRGDIEQLFLDINTSRDSDGDGDPANDDILEKTIFSRGRGSIYVVLTTEEEKMSAIAGAKLTNGRIVGQQFTIVSAAAYASEQVRQREERGRLAAIGKQRTGNRSVAFSFSRDSAGLPDDPLLFHWNFGDGSQSLLTNPQHTFPENDIYTVSVIVRDLATGEEIDTFETDVDLSEVIAQEPSKNDGEEKPSSTVQWSGILWSVLKWILGLGIAIGIGMVGKYLFARFRGVSLQKAIEHAEKKLVGEEVTTEPTEEAPATMALPAIPEPEPTPPPVPKQPPEPSVETPPPVSVTPAAPAPKAEPAPAPDWLKTGLQAAEEKGQTPTTPPPPPLQENAPVETPPASPPLAPPTPPASTGEETTAPPWLTQTPSTPTPQGTEALKQETSPSTPSSTEPKKLTEAEEREQEKKRLKRQRYRANKRAREQEQTKNAPPVPSEQPSQPVSTPAPKEPQTEDAPVPPWLQAAQQPRPAVAPTPPPVEGIVPPPASPEPAAPSAPVEEKPNEDEDVKFMIRADSVEEEHHSEDEKPGQTPGTAS